MSLIRKEIEDHYLEVQESERLSSGVGELERLRTEAILTAHLPPPPAVIYDVGGAAGVYAFPLAERGYTVHLVDPVELHLKQAQARASASGLSLASITLGDALLLGATSLSADAVLLFGPIYHLIDTAERHEALREAFRILKPGGVMFAAAVSRFASLIDGYVEGFLQDPDFRKIVVTDLASGQHRNPTGNSAYFTTSYFHRPEELAAEVAEAGFQNTRVLAVEGPVWSAARFNKTWKDEVQRKTLMEFLAKVEQEPSIRGASAHLVAVAERPKLEGSGAPMARGVS
ncbi:MAG TPA: class I SAM-dependent methyltransferase [Terriglobia bacterium]|nr:class I SAM-dependent methyltransferase [Terriglobia bacterium]